MGEFELEGAGQNDVAGSNVAVHVLALLHILESLGGVHAQAKLLVVRQRLDLVGYE